MAECSQEWRLSRDEAIPRLLEAHGGRIYGLGVRLCGSREEAEDLVQETFLRAYRGWHKFEGRSSPATWLYTIAAHACQRMHRRRAGEPARMASLDELLPAQEGRIGVVPTSDSDGMSEQIRRESRERVEEAIASLPVSFRLPVVLKEIVGLPVADVAAILGVKEATVKTRLHRARLKIRQMLEAVLPQRDVPPPLYSRQVCLDLLRAKQDALDRGVAMPPAIICDRCHVIFQSLDFAQDLCRQIGEGELPDELRRLVLGELRD